MTREEEIKLYLKERNIPVDSLEANSIIEGIEWADEHPVFYKSQTDEMQETEIEFADWWFSNHKKLPTYADAIEWMKRKMLDTACKWICKNMTDSTYLGANTLLSLRKTEFIERFKKAIEE